MVACEAVGGEFTPREYDFVLEACAVHVVVVEIFPVGVLSLLCFCRGGGRGRGGEGEGKGGSLGLDGGFGMGGRC